MSEKKVVPVEVWGMSWNKAAIKKGSRARPGRNLARRMKSNGRKARAVVGSRSKRVFYLARPVAAIHLVAGLVTCQYSGGWPDSHSHHWQPLVFRAASHTRAFFLLLLLYFDQVLSSHVLRNQIVFPGKNLQTPEKFNGLNFVLRRCPFGKFIFIRVHHFWRPNKMMRWADQQTPTPLSSKIILDRKIWQAPGRNTRDDNGALVRCFSNNATILFMVIFFFFFFWKRV